MMNLETKNTEMLGKYETAVENLKKYNQGTTLFDTNFSRYTVGKDYTESLNRLRIQNSDFKNCKFLAPIIRTNASGSRLESCKFDSINLENSNLQFSSLFDCKFSYCNIEGSNFNNCFMEKVVFDTDSFMGSSFLRTQFVNCKILGGEMLSSSLEFAEFKNTYFENLRLANLSMEYSEFNQVQMNQVVLPFAQLPFIFGGLDYVISTEDNISISADMGKIDRISVDEYIACFEDWKVFFYFRELYFPLANILLAQNKKDEALEVILSGILMMINHSDYRMLKYLCKLAASHESVSKTECKMLYSRIKDLIEHTILNSAQQYSYEIHMNDIKNILVENPKGESRLYLSIQTNILSDNQRVLYQIIKCIENILDCPIVDLTSKTISVRHNSPYEVIVIAIGSIVVLNKLLEIVSNTVKNIKVTSEDIMTIRELKRNRAQNYDLDNQLKKAELQKEELEIKKLILEIEQLQNALKQNNVQTTITHNIKENDKIYIA